VICHLEQTPLHDVGEEPVPDWIHAVCKMMDRPRKWPITFQGSFLYEHDVYDTLLSYHGIRS
jgi:hypothetical protein